MEHSVTYFLHQVIDKKLKKIQVSTSLTRLSPEKLVLSMWDVLSLFHQIMQKMLLKAGNMAIQHQVESPPSLMQVTYVHLHSAPQQKSVSRVSINTNSVTYHPPHTLAAITNSAQREKNPR